MTAVRPDRPRIIAPKYKWDALPKLIATDPYLKGWNDTIFGNATDYYGKPPVVYFMDGPSGILDNAREVKMRVKAFAYAYRMSSDTKWVDRCWAELQVSFAYCFRTSQAGLNLSHRTLPETVPPHSVPRPIDGIRLISWTLQNLLLPSASPTIGSTTCGALIKKRPSGIL